MHSRQQLIERFLHDAGWASAKREYLAGDMSSRKYTRLNRLGETAILMDAAEPMTTFANMTAWLRQQGLSAPRILSNDADHGLLLLEDLGDTSLRQLLRDSPDVRDEMMEECISLLLKIRLSTPPPLASPSPEELVTWTKLADEYYPSVNSEGLEPLRRRLVQVLRDLHAVEPTVSLRDFHSDNIMWLPKRRGMLRLGLLDYQDAFLTHPAYDLVSFLTDARLWISKDTRELVLKRYLEQSGDDPKTFGLAFAALAIQRNLRILGIFSRAKKHLASLPNTYRYLTEALEHPSFADLRARTLEALPPPVDFK